MNRQKANRPFIHHGTPPEIHGYVPRRSTQERVDRGFNASGSSKCTMWPAPGISTHSTSGKHASRRCSSSGAR